ncbi:MAG: trypsin-like peptidase domain-containing protein, partial [Rhodoferax sp.]|nr:trypsin-like peptidase domain-containing protein [Rhodoferax sp.]
MKSNLLTPRRMVVALAAAGLVGIGGLGALAQSHSQAATPAPQPVAMAVAPTPALPNFAQIAALRGPAVVNVSVSGMSRTANEAPALGSPGLDPSDPFFEFYRRFMQPNGPGLQPRNVPVHAQGSGFIVSADGVILTNAHVVQDARDVTVKLTDRREFTAKVLGADPKTDVAVLK